MSIIFDEIQKLSVLKKAWTLNALAKQGLTSTERRMVQIMCGVSLADRVPTE